MSDEPKRYTFEPYPAGVPLTGEGTPEVNGVDDLIRLLVTVRHRFGDTIVKFHVSWGSKGLQAHDRQRRNIDALRAGLSELVMLQSHYAMLLNQFDGGKRTAFVSGDEWIDRLVELGKIERPNFTE